MTNIRKHLKFIRYFILIMLFIKVFRTTLISETHIVLLIALCPLIILIDLIKYSFKKKNSHWYCLSLALCLIMTGVLKYFINDFIISIYMFSYVIEILFMKGITKQFFLIGHCCLYLLPIVLKTSVLNITERTTTIGTNLLIYLSTICILYLSHSFRMEREETEKLNEALKLSYLKLQDYSLKVEELSATKERQRVAQELHDSLGHSLMALSMHLDYAEKIFYKNPEKTREAILKAIEISKTSTADLRTVVNTLKEKRNMEDLKNAINELIDSFKVLGNIKINFIMDRQLEQLNPDIKLCLYKTIRESITNGMKHGKANTFNVEMYINLNNNNLELTIEDNGLGCDTIVKSNGLKGIENRVSALGGNVDFTSRPDCGFLIKAIIPIYEETK